MVLGSAAGGGVPQWNCRCRVCSLAWAGDPRVARRTQSSLAVSADGEQWMLVNCAPEVLAQIGAAPALQPRWQAGRRGRDSPIGAVLVTNGDVDHVAGLLSLRESQPFDLYATPEIHAALRQSRIFDVLAEERVRRLPLAFEHPLEPLPGLEVRVFPVPGKAALYLEGPAPEIGALGEATVGLELRAGSRSLFYVPGCARLDAALAERLRGAPALLFDGTLWDDREMIEAGLGVKTGRRMGHMPIAGEGGSLEAFAELEIERKVFVHVNNSNPILIEDSPERAAVAAAGWDVARDGLEIRP